MAYSGHDLFEGCRGISGKTRCDCCSFEPAVPLAVPLVLPLAVRALQCVSRSACLEVLLSLAAKRRHAYGYHSEQAKCCACNIQHHCTAGAVRFLV